MALREADLFRSAPVDGLAALARRLHVASLAPGDEVALSDAGELTIVVEGQVTWAGLEGARTPGAATAGAGAVLGLRDALAGDPPMVDVRAASSVVLLRAPLTDLLDVLDDHHAMGRRLMTELMTMVAAGR
jgi:CRP-like cAMP-binding protein